MSGIGLPDGSSWMVPRIFYRNLLDRVESMTTDPDVILELRSGQANEMIFLDMLEPYLARELSDLLVRAADAEIDKFRSTPEEREQAYVRCLTDLKQRLSDPGPSG